MPHIMIKLWPGIDSGQKNALTKRIVQDVTETLGFQPGSVSIAFEEINPADWQQKVFKPEILDKWHLLTKKPSYGPIPDLN